MDGVSLFLRSDDVDREALRSHFLPDYPETGVRRRHLVVRKVQTLLEEYFDSFRSFLAVQPYSDEREKEHQRLKMQRSLMRQILGDPANALAPTRMATLVSQRPEWTESYIAATEDALYGVLEHYAKKHHIDMVRLVGKEGLRQTINPDPRSEPDVSRTAAPSETLPDDQSDSAPVIEPETVAEVPTEQIDVPEEPEEDDLLLASIAGELPDGTRVDWGAAAALSDQLGRLEEEARDPDWWTTATLVLSYPQGYRDDAYFNSGALSHRLLDDSEVEELYRRMQAAITALRMLNEDQESNPAEHELLVRTAVLGYRARGVLIRHNLRLAAHWALRRHGMVELDDLAQAGNIGLITAIDSFRPYREALREGRSPEPDEPMGKISTLAHYHIRGIIMRTIGAEKRWRVMQSRNYIDPVGVLSPGDRQVLLRAHDEAKRLNPDVTYKEVGEWLGFSEGSVNRLLAGKFALSVASLNKLADSELDEGTLEDILSFIEDPRAAASFEESEYQGIRNRFWATIQSMVNAREYQILVLRHVYKMTHEAISGKFGLSRERIRQLEKQALRRLKDAAPDGFDITTFERNIPEPEPTQPSKAGVEDVLNGLRMTNQVPTQTYMGKPVFGASALFSKLGLRVEGESEAIRDRARRLLACFELTEIEAAVMRERYGLGDNELGQTQQLTADKLKMTRAHVSMVDSRIIRLLRAHLPKASGK